jgi:hypothetical protein
MIRDIYSTVECKELFFTHQKISFKEVNFSRVCSCELFCFTQKIKELWHEIFKKCCFQKLRFALILRDFSN